MLTEQTAEKISQKEFKKISIPVSPRNKNIIKKFIEDLLLKINYFIYFKTRVYQKIIKLLWPINTPGEIIWLNPSLINYIVFNNKHGNNLAHLSEVNSGNWDLDQVKIKELDIYQSLWECIINNQPLRSTKFYNPNIKDNSDYKKEGVLRTWEYISEYEYEIRNKKILNLIKDIKEKGFRTQLQLDEVPNDEILVKVDRNGRILLFNGIHRFCIAKILRLNEIPVIVKTRHTEWYNFKNELTNYIKKLTTNLENDFYLTTKFTHPDLQEISTFSKDDVRFSIIEKNRITKGGSLLDIGAGFGYFSSRFEELGYYCTAVEKNPNLFYFMEKIKKAEEKSYEIINDDVLDIYNKPVKFDIVFALNVFNKYLKTKNQFTKFINFLKNLTAKEMFFENHPNREGEKKSYYKNFNNEEFVKIIMNHTGLIKSEKLLEYNRGKQLYHLWKD